MRFRKKPAIIEAVQFTGANLSDCLRFMGQPPVAVGAYRTAGKLAIDTPEGVMTASPGDWIIRGVKGEHYPCKPDIFAATYEAVDEYTPPPPTSIPGPGVPRS